ncbi:hypothetical protein ACFPZ0_24560 [Streptomonospora nanhaiensis]|uniref:hypothetical protein n=1 Tax=Streptomonospora nanhaiensis TaxID=1323731 RepID=UPI001C995E8C|nr:hypothetical protein [Streptomonospora nanhaiensis]MBX9391314.1 hypothetical protein [Streptomonospora nanhaiensis]
MAGKPSSKTPGARDAGGPHAPPRSGSRFAAVAVTALGVLVIAACAVLLSYNGIYQIAVQGNIDRRYAHLYPGAFTLLMLMAFWGGYLLRTAPRSRRLWVDALILLLILLAAGASALRAYGLVLLPDVAVVVAAVAPWVALLAAFRIFLSVVMHLRGEIPGTRPRAARRRAEPVDDGTEPPTAPLAAPAATEPAALAEEDGLARRPRPADEAPRLLRDDDPTHRLDYPGPADDPAPDRYEGRPVGVDTASAGREELFDREGTDDRGMAGAAAQPAPPAAGRRTEERVARPEPVADTVPADRADDGVDAKPLWPESAGGPEPDTGTVRTHPLALRHALRAEDTGVEDTRSAAPDSPLGPAGADDAAAARRGAAAAPEETPAPAAGDPSAETATAARSEPAHADGDRDAATGGRDDHDDRADSDDVYAAWGAVPRTAADDDRPRAEPERTGAAGTGDTHGEDGTAADAPAPALSVAAAGDGDRDRSDAPDGPDGAGSDLPRRTRRENPIKRAAQAPPGAPGSPAERHGTDADSEPAFAEDGFVDDLPPGDPTNDEGEPLTAAPEQPGADPTAPAAEDSEPAPAAAEPDPLPPPEGPAHSAAPPIEKRPMVLKPRRSPRRQGSSPFPAEPPSNRVRSQPTPPDED